MNFGKVQIKSVSARNVQIKNMSMLPVSVSLHFGKGSGFSVSQEEFFLGIYDSVQVLVTFSPAQNISYRNTLFITTAETGQSVPVTLRGEGGALSQYDAATFDKWDNALKTALNGLVINHTSLGYNTGRDRMYENIDKQPGDTIECVYTGIKIQAATRTIAQNQGFDTEHTWPQGTFSQAEPMRSDIFHLYPTNSSANNTRGNYPFGKVVSGINWQVGGSKRGLDYRNVIVFEPRDVHKGDAARAMFYFITRYQNYQNYMDTVQENVLKEWSKFDTVSATEAARNTKIASYQGKRNPLIDHPEFIDRIASFVNTSLTTPQKPAALLSADSLHLRYEWVGEQGDSSTLWLYLANVSRGSLTYQTSSLNSEVFRVYTNDNTVGFGEVDSLLIVFAPAVQGYYQTELLLSTNDGIFRVPVRGTAVSGSAGEPEVNAVKDFKIIGSYPNPFNGSAVLRYHIYTAGEVTAKLYTLNGEKVKDLFAGEMTAGEHTLRIEMSGMPSGIYFVRLQSGQKSESLPIHYMK
ncbi:MAG: hypothetical protein FMNOHCHN_03697 [Ignavibacteriaceae bacterium]|nr:hypothetical protein [Ignavibacteriaceae bacterium]